MRKFLLPILFVSLIVATCAATSAQNSGKYTVENSRDLKVVPANGERRALLIATGRYANRRISNLSGVDPDVDLIRERLLDPHCGFKDENVVVLKTDDFPTLDNINEALDNFLDSCGPNDFAFLFLSGHGVRDPKTNVDYYVPQDGRPILEDGRVVAFDSSTCLSLQTLKEKIERCDARFKWVIVDACRTNLNAKGMDDQWNAIGELEAAEGSLWFQSCGVDRQSYEISFEEDGQKVVHGLFTWFFCQGAKGEAANKDGLISPLGLFRYAREKMKEARNDNRDVPEQAPLYSCQDLSDGEFVFVDLSDGKEVRAEKAYHDALQFFLDGKYEEARTKIDEATTLDPQNQNFQALKGRIEDILAKSETDKKIQTYIAQGWKFYDEKKYTEAVKEADEALKLDPKNAGALALKNRAENPPVDKPAENTSVVRNPPVDKPAGNVIVNGSEELPIDFVDSHGKEYRLIKAGSFMMGSPLTGKEIVAKYDLPTYFAVAFDNTHQHRVTLTQDFYLAKRPVTRGEFKKFVEATHYKTTAEEKGSAYTLKDDGSRDWGDGASWKKPGFEQTDEHPVVCVSYEDALAYIDWLNKTSSSSTKLNGLKPTYRLPTEAEWEYACRAGTAAEFFWGDEEEKGKGYLNAAGTEKNPAGEKLDYNFSFDDGYYATSPVGNFKPNPWGLYDMLGNVWEWTSDWYGDYPKESATDPTGAEESSFRVLRGGGWDDIPARCRCAYRYRGVPAGRSAYNGMRVGFSLTTK